jgi:uncharacterized Rmd1/YagE family protein
MRRDALSLCRRNRQMMAVAPDRLNRTDLPDVRMAEPASSAQPRRARALLLGDRINTSAIDRAQVICPAPLTYRLGGDGYVTLFRYGVAVLIGLTPAQEDEVLRDLRARVSRPVDVPEEETAYVAVDAAKDDQILPGGPITLKTLTPEHLIVVADALAKSVVLARDEREVAAVFDLVEPFARQLAEKGGTTGGRRAILKHIGNALLVQHRVSGRVAVAEKPELVWDRYDLERLVARLQDEYELKERAEALSRKLAVIAETAEVLTDIIDTRRSLRLEIIIVALIAFELIIAGYQILR